MSDIPSRQTLGRLIEAAREVVPAQTLGVSWVDEARASVVYSHSNGVGQFLLAAADLPRVMQPSDGLNETDMAALSSNPAGAVEWLMALGGIRRVASMPVVGGTRPGRLWVGLSEAAPLTSGQTGRLLEIAAAGADALRVELTAETLAERLRRLELSAGLMPALLHVLDVRDVFDRLSQIAAAALPHDLLMLRLFSEDMSKITVYAHSARGTQVSEAVPQLYPVAVTQAWEFDIVDDLSQHPIERDQPPARLGARSALRLPVRFDDRVIGGVGVFSRAPGAFTTEDVAVARRLADQVAVGLSHHRLAEQGRRAAALQERTTNLEMLEGLLNTLAGVLDIRDVFDRVSAIATRVLPHDGMSIVENIEDFTRVRFHATHGLGDLPQPFDIPVPDPALVAEDWDYRLIDDIREVPAFSRSPALSAGMRSMILVAIRVGGRLFGGLNFYARAPGRYQQDDVLVARRIADHVALALSHRQLAEQARRHEDLRARSEKSELLDDLLAMLVASGELSGVFDRLSALARKVLPHDALFLTVLSADGSRARQYVSSGVDMSGFPDEIEIPEPLRHVEWDHQLADDLTTEAESDASLMTRQGFRSALQVPIRLDGRMVGGLAFLSRTVAAFTQEDLAVARRVADRVALSLSRERRLEATRRADEAADRAAKLEARVRALTEELDARTGYRRIVGDSREWRHVLTQATQVAGTEATVLLLGESGTGKEVVARFLHRASGRKAGPFVALNCAALPEQLLEAELFGYERGAFTGATQSKPGQLEQASGGTLFLDEVGEMSLPAQAKFLRVLQEREFQRLGGTRVLRTDARIVAATNRDLQKAIANTQFREDLYYRLNVFAIRLPALRERRSDVLPLSEAFLTEIGRGLGRPPGGISREARELLVNYHWPGNVRELRNILERAAILCDGGLIAAEHLAISAPPPPVTAAPAPAPKMDDLVVAAPAGSAAGDLQSMERAMIEQALQSARFNKSKAAKTLGLTRHQLYIRMRKYGFE